MNSTRRQFVASTIAGLPVIMYAPQSQAQSRSDGPPSDDLVLAQIEGDVERAYSELRENPKRLDSLRGLESALRFHAAYATTARLDESLKKTIARHVRFRGKAQWIDDLAGDTHANHRRFDELKKRHPRLAVDPRLGEFRPVPREHVEQVLDQVLKGGIGPTLTKVANEVQRLRERASEGQAQGFVRAMAREGLCDVIKDIVRGLEIIVGIVCGMAMFDPLLMPECAVLTMEWVAADWMSWACELI